MALRFAAGYDHDWVLILEAKSPGAAPPSRETGASAEKPAQLTLANEHLAWRFDWTDGRLRSSSFENKLSGHRFARSSVQELALNFSASLDCVQEPFTRMADFEVAAAKLIADHHPVFELYSSSVAVNAKLHYQLDGATRRKWVEVKNQTGRELLLLDVELDDFATEGASSAADKDNRCSSRANPWRPGARPARASSGSSSTLPIEVAGNRSGLTRQRTIS